MGLSYRRCGRGLFPSCSSGLPRPSLTPRPLPGPIRISYQVPALPATGFAKILPGGRKVLPALRAHAYSRLPSSEMRTATRMYPFDLVFNGWPGCEQTVGNVIVSPTGTSAVLLRHLNTSYTHHREFASYWVGMNKCTALSSHRKFLCNSSSCEQ